MTDSLMESVRSGLIDGADFLNPVVDAPVPSSAAIAKADIRRMLDDRDVQDLTQDIRDATERFALEIARSFLFNSATSMAVFGDSEEGVGEITLLDRAGRKEMQVTIREGGVADIWMRSASGRHALSGLREGHMPLLSAMFLAMR